jgi:hypothetical protein
MHTSILAQPIRTCCLFVGETALQTLGLVRIALLPANVAPGFFVWPSGMFHLYDETARPFEAAIVSF